MQLPGQVHNSSCHLHLVRELHPVQETKRKFSSLIWQDGTGAQAFPVRNDQRREELPFFTDAHPLLNVSGLPEFSQH